MFKENLKIFFRIKTPVFSKFNVMGNLVAFVKNLD